MAALTLTAAWGRQVGAGQLETEASTSGFPAPRPITVSVPSVSRDFLARHPLFKQVTALIEEEPGRGLHESFEGLGSDGCPGNGELEADQHREGHDTLYQCHVLGQENGGKGRAERHGDDQVEGIQLRQRPLAEQPYEDDERPIRDCPEDDRADDRLPVVEQHRESRLDWTSGDWLEDQGEQADHHCESDEKDDANGSTDEFQHVVLLMFVCKIMQSMMVSPGETKREAIRGNDQTVMTFRNPRAMVQGTAGDCPLAAGT